MNGCVGEWMDGSVAGLGWVDVCVDGWINRRIDRWFKEWMNKEMYGRIRRIDG